MTFNFTKPVLPEIKLSTWKNSFFCLPNSKVFNDRPLLILLHLSWSELCLTQDLIQTISCLCTSFYLHQMSNGGLCTSVHSMELISSSTPLPLASSTREMLACMLVKITWADLFHINTWQRLSSYPPERLLGIIGLNQAASFCIWWLSSSFILCVEIWAS